MWYLTWNTDIIVLLFDESRFIFSLVLFIVYCSLPPPTTTPPTHHPHTFLNLYRRIYSNCQHLNNEIYTTTSLYFFLILFFFFFWIFVWGNKFDICSKIWKKIKLHYHHGNHHSFINYRDIHITFWLKKYIWDSICAVIITDSIFFSWITWLEPVGVLELNLNLSALRPKERIMEEIMNFGLLKSLRIPRLTKAHVEGIEDMMRGCQSRPFMSFSISFSTLSQILVPDGLWHGFCTGTSNINILILSSWSYFLS